MDLIDETICRAILEAAADKFGSWTNLEQLSGIAEGHVLGINARYLEGEGLVEVKWRRTGERDRPFGPLRITQAGVNYLRGDGGLVARQQVTTVRLHEDTLKALLEMSIQRAPDLPDDQKTRLLEALKGIPAEATRSLALRVVDLAVQNTPALLQLLRTGLA